MKIFDFVVVDFETATPAYHSPCEIGLAFVNSKSEITENQSFLIKPHCYPEFYPKNIDIHGITPEKVADAPDFPTVWKHIYPKIHGKIIIAHNAQFDMGVLEKTLKFYRIPVPELYYSCSLQFARYVWQDFPSHGLKFLCEKFKIPLDHHRAAADAEATAKVFMKCLEDSDVKNYGEFCEKIDGLKIEIPKLVKLFFPKKTTQVVMAMELNEIGKRIGKPLFKMSYEDIPKAKYYNTPKTNKVRTSKAQKGFARNMGNEVDIKQLREDFSVEDNVPDDHPLRSQIVVFTGNTVDLSRQDYMINVLLKGGDTHPRITKKVTTLVIGQDSWADYLSGIKSSKIKKAEEYNAKYELGIQILSEEEFSEKYLL